MPGSTTFAGIKFAEGPDEVNKFPTEVSSPGAKTIDKYLEEHTLTFKTRAASYSAVSGEFGVQTSSAKTTTLPAAATASQLIGVFAKCAEVKVTTSGGAFIIGKTELTAATEAAKVATVVLTEGMTAFFFSDGTNWELWGQIKPEQIYVNKSFTKAEAEAEVEPSATRTAYVAFSTINLSALKIGGVLMPAGSGPCGFLVPPGQKWRMTIAVETVTLLL